jgi:hypothetical protein
MGVPIYLRLVIGGLAKLFSTPPNVGVELSLDRNGNRGPHGEPGSGALSSINGYQVSAEESKWHASVRIKNLFDILLKRVGYHQRALVRTHQETVYVPLLKDITADELLFNRIENGDIELYHMPTSPPDRKKKQDIWHRLARLAFLAHLLEQPMWYSRNGKIELHEVNDAECLEQVATNGARMERDILYHYFSELHRLDPNLRASPDPSYEEHLRFWRYIDIEYRDYVAYSASLPKDTFADAERNFLNATLLVRVLIDNEAWFHTAFPDSLAEGLSVENCEGRVVWQLMQG